MTERPYNTFSDQEKKDMALMLKNDFIDRDNCTFVKIRTNGTTGWERTLAKGSAYSTYMTDEPEKLIKNAYRHACDMVSAMDVPFKVKILITPRKNATNTKKLWLATEVFDDKEMTAAQKLDCFTGEAVHECAHLLYTDFNLIRNINDKITKDLENIIEDERIERKTGDEKPGMAQFIKAVKYYYFDRYLQAKTEKEKAGKLPKMARIINAIISIIRYPKTADEKDIEEFAPLLTDVREILTPYPETTEEVIESAVKIRELIKKLYKEEQQKEENNQQEKNEEETDQDNNDDTEGCNEENNDEEQDNQAAESQMQIEIEEISDILDKIITDPQDGEEDNSLEARMSKDIQKNRGRLGLECEGVIGKANTDNAVIIYPQENKDQYNESKRRIQKYIPAMSKALKCNAQDKERTLKGLGSGKLDTNKLAEAFQSVQTVYITTKTVKSGSVNVCILIDESGSMRGERIQAARDTAILINETLKDIKNTSLSIYGYTGNGEEAYIIPYIENGKGKKHSLGCINYQGTTPTAKAIQETITRIKKQTNNIMMIISDGEPDEGITEVRKQTEQATKKGIRTIGISISPTLKEDDLKRMYRENLTITDLSTLAPELGKILKKKILEKNKS